MQNTGDRDFTSQASRPLFFEPPVAEMLKYRGPGLHKSSVPSLVLRTPSCRNAEMSGTETSQVKRLVPLSFEPPVAEMPKCPGAYSFGFSRFVKSGYKGYPCSLESPVAETPKSPCTYSFRFSRFVKSGYRGCLCSLESPVAEVSKHRNVPAFNQRLTTIPGINGSGRIAISQFGILKDKDLCLSNSRYPKSRNGPMVQIGL
jgi:hypothetical protein